MIITAETKQVDGKVNGSTDSVRQNLRDLYKVARCLVGYQAEIKVRALVPTITKIWDGGSTVELYHKCDVTFNSEKGKITIKSSGENNFFHYTATKY